MIVREYKSMGDIRRSAVEAACREYAREQYSINRVRKLIDYCMTKQYLEGRGYEDEEGNPYF